MQALGPGSDLQLEPELVEWLAPERKWERVMSALETTSCELSRRF